jgi:hypothetical protein
VRLETGHREHSVDLVEGMPLQKEAQQQPEQSKAEEKAQQIADLQELVIRSAQEAARRADEHARHDELAQAQERQQGQSLEHGMGM